MSEPDSTNSNALLELQSDSMGLLLPRVALINTETHEPLNQHVEGMVIYNTSNNENVNSGLYYNDGFSWQKLHSGLNSECSCQTTAHVRLLAQDIENTGIGGIPFLLLPSPGTNKIIDVSSVLLVYTFEGDSAFVADDDAYGEIRISGNLLHVDASFIGEKNDFKIKMPFMENAIFSNIEKNSPIYLTFIIPNSPSIPQIRRESPINTKGFLDVYITYQTINLN